MLLEHRHPATDQDPRASASYPERWTCTSRHHALLRLSRQHRQRGPLVLQRGSYATTFQFETVIRSSGYKHGASCGFVAIQCGRNVALTTDGDEWLR